RRCRWSRHQRSIELRLTPRVGNGIDVQLFTMATQDAERHTLQLRTAILDISMRKRAEGAARESRRQLEQIVAERTAELTSERQRREEHSGSYMKLVRFCRFPSITKSRSGRLPALGFRIWQMPASWTWSKTMGRSNVPLPYMRRARKNAYFGISKSIQPPQMSSAQARRS